MRMGRLTNPKTLAEVVKLKKEGVKNGVICQKVGIARETLIKWRQKGRELFEEIQKEELELDELTAQEQLFLNFFTEFDGADADFQIKQHNKISKARGWQSAAWLLERHGNQEEYLKPKETAEEYSGSSGNGMLVNFLEYVQSVAEDTLEDDKEEK